MHGSDMKLCLVLIMSACAASPKNKEIETIITGSKYSGGVGIVTAPPGFPDTIYTRDATSYIFVLENVAVEGSVQLVVDVFDLHPKSWVTVRNSKYGGYIGRVLGRYDTKNLPPLVIRTDTCCMRVEFQTGCCGPGEAGYSGFQATYKFVRIPGKGRRSACSKDKVYSKLCNGECIPSVWECPCPKYGQYKCENQMCIAQEKVCDGYDDCGDSSEENLCKYTGHHSGEEEDLGPMFAFSVIMMTVCLMLGVSCILICILRWTEHFRKSRLKGKQPFIKYTGPRLYAKIWPKPEIGIRYGSYSVVQPKESEYSVLGNQAPDITMVTASPEQDVDADMDTSTQEPLLHGDNLTIILEECAPTSRVSNREDDFVKSIYENNTVDANSSSIEASSSDICTCVDMEETRETKDKREEPNKVFPRNAYINVNDSDNGFQPQTKSNYHCDGHNYDVKRSPKLSVDSKQLRTQSYDDKRSPTLKVDYKQTSSQNSNKQFPVLPNNIGEERSGLTYKPFHLNSNTAEDNNKANSQIEQNNVTEQSKQHVEMETGSMKQTKDRLKYKKNRKQNGERDSRKENSEVWEIRQNTHSPQGSRETSNQGRDILRRFFQRRQTRV